MSAKHTPGPWRVDGAEITHGAVSGFYVAAQESGGRIGKVFKNCLVTTEAEVLANALLIAAAPDLLEALQFVMSAHGEQLTTAFEMAQDAIAKATRETQ